MKKRNNKNSGNYQQHTHTAQVETNNNKNLGVSEQVQALCFGDRLSTRGKRNY